MKTTGKKVLLPLLLALSLLLLLPAGCGQKNIPEGVPRMCVSCPDGRLLLLFSQSLSSDKEPIRQDTIWLYRPDTDQYEPVFTTENLWDGPDCQLTLAGDRVLFHNGEGRLFSYDQTGDGWRITDLTKSLDQPYTISPDGTLWAIRRETGIELIRLADDQVLGLLAAQGSAEEDFRAMRWDSGGTRLAVVRGGGSGTTLWDTQTLESITVSAYEDFSPPVGWVDIPEARAAGRYLLVHVLRETGAAMVIFDLETQAEYAAPFWEGEITLLDVRGEEFLYEHIPPEGPHTLNLYRCADRESWRLGEWEGSYTAACFAGEGTVFCCKYDPKAQQSQLERISYGR